MNDLRIVLAKFAAKSPKLGAEAAPRSDDSNALQSAANELRNSLKEVSVRNRAYFLTCVAMIALLFIAACWISLAHLQDPSFVRNVFAVTGISFVGLISQMIRLWKTKVLSDMTLVLAGNLNPGDLRPIIELLLSSIKV
jgi:hypothetical protein